MVKCLLFWIFKQSWCLRVFLFTERHFALKDFFRSLSLVSSWMCLTATSTLMLSSSSPKCTEACNTFLAPNPNPNPYFSHSSFYLPPMLIVIFFQISVHSGTLEKRVLQLGSLYDSGCSWILRPCCYTSLSGNPTDAAVKHNLVFVQWKQWKACR